MIFFNEILLIIDDPKYEEYIQKTATDNDVGVEIGESNPIENIVNTMFRIIIENTEETVKTPIFKCEFKEIFHILLFGKNHLKYLESLNETDKSSRCCNLIREKEIFFHCKTCSISPSVALCFNCFDINNHINHDYAICKLNTIGMCDCGDENSIKSEGTCCYHRKNLKIKKNFYDNTQNDGRHVIDVLSGFNVKTMMYTFIGMLKVMREMWVYDNNVEPSKYKYINTNDDFNVRLICLFDEFWNCINDCIKISSVFRNIVAHTLVSSDIYRNISFSLKQICSYNVEISNLKPINNNDLNEFKNDIIHVNILGELLFWLIQTDSLSTLQDTFLLCFENDNFRKVLFKIVSMHYKLMYRCIIDATLKNNDNRVKQTCSHQRNLMTQVLMCMDYIPILINHNVIETILNHMYSFVYTIDRFIDSKDNVFLFPEIVKFAILFPPLDDFCIVLNSDFICKTFVWNENLLILYLSVLKRFEFSFFKDMAHSESLDVQHYWYSQIADKIIKKLYNQLDLIERIVNTTADFMMTYFYSKNLSIPISCSHPLIRFFMISLFTLLQQQKQIKKNFFLRFGTNFSFSIIHGFVIRTIGKNETLEDTADVIDSYTNSTHCVFMVDTDLLFIQTLISDFSSEWLLYKYFTLLNSTTNFKFMQGVILNKPYHILIQSYVIMIIQIMTVQNFGYSGETKNELLRKEILTILFSGKTSYDSIVKSIPRNQEIQVCHDPFQYTRDDFDSILDDVTTYTEPKINLSQYTKTTGQYIVNPQLWITDYDPMYSYHRCCRAIKKGCVFHDLNNYSLICRKLKISKYECNWPPFRIPNFPKSCHNYTTITILSNSLCLQSSTFIQLYFAMYTDNLTKETVSAILFLLELFIIYDQKNETFINSEPRDNCFRCSSFSINFYKIVYKLPNITTKDFLKTAGNARSDAIEDLIIKKEMMMNNNKHKTTDDCDDIRFFKLKKPESFFTLLIKLAKKMKVLNDLMLFIDYDPKDYRNIDAIKKGYDFENDKKNFYFEMKQVTRIGSKPHTFSYLFSRIYANFPKSRKIIDHHLKKKRNLSKNLSNNIKLKNNERKLEILKKFAKNRLKFENESLKNCNEAKKKYRKCDKLYYCEFCKLIEMSTIHSSYVVLVNISDTGLQFLLSPDFSDLCHNIIKKTYFNLSLCRMELIKTFIDQYSKYLSYVQIRGVSLISSCGHYAHQRCFAEYYNLNRHKFFNHIMIHNSPFCCPRCRFTCNFAVSVEPSQFSPNDVYPLYYFENHSNFPRFFHMNKVPVRSLYSFFNNQVNNLLQHNVGNNYNKNVIRLMKNWCVCTIKLNVDYLICIKRVSLIHKNSNFIYPMLTKLNAIYLQARCNMLYIDIFESPANHNDPPTLLEEVSIVYFHILLSSRCDAISLEGFMSLSKAVFFLKYIQILCYIAFTISRDEANTYASRKRTNSINGDDHIHYLSIILEHIQLNYDKNFDSFVNNKLQSIPWSNATIEKKIHKLGLHLLRIISIIQNATFPNKKPNKINQDGTDEFVELYKFVFKIDISKDNVRMNRNFLYPNYPTPLLEKWVVHLAINIKNKSDLPDLVSLLNMNLIDYIHPSFINLPQDYISLIAKYQNILCYNCQIKYTNKIRVLCVLCGKVMCYRRKCRDMYTCFLHSKDCGYFVNIYLNLTTTMIYVVYKQCIIEWGTLYLSPHGEEIMIGYKNAKLNADRMKLLSHQWKTNSFEKSVSIYNCFFHHNRY